MFLFLKKEYVDFIRTQTPLKRWKVLPDGSGKIYDWDAEGEGYNQILLGEYGKDAISLAHDIDHENYDEKELDHPLSPKIYKYVRGIYSAKHFQDLDYKRDLFQKLVPEEVFGTGVNKGLLIGMNYYSDDEKTDLVLVMEREYVSAPYVGLISKWTTRKWVMNNGEFHPNIQKPIKPSKYTSNASRTATERRRNTIVINLKEKVSGLLQSATYSSGEEMLAALHLGASFLAEIAPLTESYIQSGQVDKIQSYVNDSAVHSIYPFLLKPLNAEGTYFVKDLLVDELTY